MTPANVPSLVATRRHPLYRRPAHLAGADETPGNDPFATRVEDDAGDTTQRNFAYQHAYGGYLLISALRGHFPYEAVWCEHHEDLVAERSDGKLDAFQVKTRDHDAWRTSDEPFRTAVGTLTRVRLTLGDRLDALTFVSNQPVLKTKSRQPSERKKSPDVLTTSAAACGALSDLEPGLKKVVEAIAKATSHAADAIFHTLRRLKIVRAWDRDSIDAQVKEHLSFLPDLKMAGTPKVLAELSRRLVARFSEASSLRCTDPAKFYGPLRPQHVADPQLASKRVALAELQSWVESACGSDFRYPTSPGEVPAFIDAVQRSGGTRLRKKMLLAQIPPARIETAATRANATFDRLMERQARDEGAALDLFHQLRHYVSAEYAEAETAVRAAGVPLEDAGPKLMADVDARLRALAARNLAPLEGEPYETLSGVSAMLTDECSLWWGPERALEVPDDD
jgi:hypothetical protein